MERKIGEIFDYDGLKLEVVENDDNHCEGCYFQKWIICRFPVIADKTGACSADERDDKKEVVFQVVTDEE